MTRPMVSRRSAAMTPAIDASSLRVGMTTAMLPAPAMASQAPAQAAARARRGRMVGQEPGAEIAIGRSVPDLAQRLLRRVAERVVLIAALGERRDAAGQ